MNILDKLTGAEEDVRGVIVGDGRADYLYKFYYHRKDLGITEFITQGYFDNDADAEAWLKEHYPEYYARGVEVRCYDQERQA